MTRLEMPITSVKLAIHLGPQVAEETRAEVAAAPLEDPPFEDIAGFEF